MPDSSDLGQSYSQALHWLFGLTDLERQPMTRAMQGAMTLERPAALLDLLGRPQQAYHAILVAGSKGKGSTAVMLASILQAAGYRTGLYSKPHLHTYRERIRVQGALISESDFAESVGRFQRLLPLLSQSRPDLGIPTTFEVTTALALDYFARRHVQVAVIEVGLGGRLDATNVVEADLALITSISLEHTAILGDTLAEIASEKAGIIKRGKAVLVAPQSTEALHVFRQVARERGAPLGIGGADWLWHGTNADFEVRAIVARANLWPEAWKHEDLHLGLLGSHQIENAATAVAAAEVLKGQGLTVEEAAVREGLARARWPGRLELAARKTEHHAPIVVDGAHNGDSAERLAAGLREHFHYGRLWLILAVYGDKDLRAIIAPFREMLAGVWTVQTRQPRCRPAAEVAAALRALGVPAEPAASTREAIDRALDVASPDDLICATGSLSIVAETREALGLVPPDERDPL